MITGLSTTIRAVYGPVLGCEAIDGPTAGVNNHDEIFIEREDSHQSKNIKLKSQLKSAVKMADDGKSESHEVLRLLHQTRNISLDASESKWNGVSLFSSLLD